jgi:hypothetical protein
LHVPNYLVSATVCDKCRINLNSEFCELCGIRQNIFDSEPINNFVEFVKLPRKYFKHIIVIAHYGGKYDNYFLNVLGLAPQVTMKGSQIISMNEGNIKFLDSFSFIPLPLSNFYSTA